MQRELRTLNLDEYHRLIEIDFFCPDERVELIDGFLFTNNPVSPRKRACRHRLMRLLQSELRQRAQVLMKSPITLPNSNSEPEPDIVVVQARGDEYANQHPSANDIFLVVEVSRSILESDRDMKYQLYARESIAEYWILNLVDDLLEVHQGPYVDSTGVAGYRMKQTFDRNERISPLVFSGCQILVDEMFP